MMKISCILSFKLPFKAIQVKIVTKLLSRFWKVLNIVYSVKLLKQISLLYWFIICIIINLCCRARAVQLKDLWFICILILELFHSLFFQFFFYWNNPIKILIRYKVLLTFTSLYMYIMSNIVWVSKIRARKSHQVFVAFAWIIYRLAAKKNIVLSSMASVREQSKFLRYYINHN